jgi:hypothetical protein
MPGGYSEIGQIDPSSAVLLLGSGFSLASTNIRGKNPPNGSGLRQYFIEALGLPADTSYDLQILTEEFAEQDSSRLYDELYSIFRISVASAAQRQIFSEDWQRIYTTNYDDTVEVCQLQRGLTPTSYDCADDVPNKLPKNSVIHLHGSIRAATNENILSSLVLGESSYVRQYVSKSPWYNQFQSDIRFASAVFVIGYSMADYHISALLLENPEVAKKTFFIQRAEIDPIFVRRTKAYGSTLFIGLDGFAEAVEKLPRPEPIADITRLKSFRALSPQRDNKSVRPPTANEVFELLVFGSFNYARCVSTLPAQTYVISRDAGIRQLVSEISKNRTIIVDGRLGNGKTIFLYLAFIALAGEKYSCFLYRDRGPSFEQELKLLRPIQNLVIMFDQYVLSQDVLKQVAAELPNAKFVLEVRTSIFEVRYHEIAQSVPRPFHRIDINRLSVGDKSAFSELCENAGLAAERLKVGPVSSEMRDLLLELFESKNIQSKIVSMLSPISESAEKRKVLIVSTLLSSYHISADPSFIKTVTGVDPFRAFADNRDVAEELFSNDGEAGFKVRSSIFAEYAVQKFIEPAEIIDCIVDAAFAAAERKRERRYRLLMSSLMQYSNMHHMLKGQSSVVQLAILIYERLRRNELINDEPLFWLQYSIAMVEDGKVLAAQEFIEAAYARAANRQGFQTYQIDTQAFRVLLLVEAEADSDAPIERFQDIVRKLEMLNSMLAEESHRAYAIKVLEGIYPFLENRKGGLTMPEKTIFTFWLAKLIATLNGLPIEYRSRTGSDRTRAIIEKAKGLLLWER